MKAIVTGLTGALRAHCIPFALALTVFLLAAFWARGNHYRDARDLWRTTARTQADATRAASAAAAIRAETARLETERRAAAHARKADHEEPPAVADLRHAADRYADAHRLRTPEASNADCRVPSHANPPASDGPAPDRDGPRADALAEVVAIPRADFDQLRDNTLRLERVRIWGEGLIADGLAVREAD